MRATTLALLFIPMIAAADIFNGPYPYTVNQVGYAYSVDLSSLTAGIQVYFSAPVSYYEFSVVFPRGAANPQVSTYVQCGTCASTVTWSELPPFLPGGAVASVSGTAPNITQMGITLSIDPYSGSQLYPVGFSISNLNQPPSTGISQIGDAPEPATLTLAGLAVGAMALGRRWRTRPGPRRQL